ncbi:hypothetical protein ACWD62_40480 [Streptomyces sp. NPDC005146]
MLAELVVSSSASPAEVVDALVAHLSKPDLAAVAELLPDGLGEDQSTVVQESVVE